MNEYSRYSRQWVLKQIGRDGQKRLHESRVAVIGLGALGSVSANLLARAGVGHLILIDRDYVEVENLQRQVLYDETDLSENLPKAVAAQNKLAKINSEIRVEAITADVNASTISELLEPVHLIIDGTDNFETRFLLNDYCLREKVPWIYGGVIRTEGMSYVVLPGAGPCLRCLFGDPPAKQDIQTCDQVGILAPVAHVVASFQATEAIKLLAGHFDEVDRRLWKVDIWNREFKAITLDHFRDSACSGCQSADYPYLVKKRGTSAVSLCGRNAVQITVHGPKRLDFKLLAARLGRKADVKFNHYMLKCRMLPYEITVFTNGRAIVKGTEDAAQARSLYAKYIGA